jgi:hypothetical protein
MVVGPSGWAGVYGALGMNTWEGVLGVDENFNMEWAPLFGFNMYVQHGWSVSPVLEKQSGCKQKRERERGLAIHIEGHFEWYVFMHIARYSHLHQIHSMKFRQAEAWR